MAFEKLGKVADILSLIVCWTFILCEIIVCIRYYDGNITVDQLLLYSVCLVVGVKILSKDRRGSKESKERERGQ